MLPPRPQRRIHDRREGVVETGRPRRRRPRARRLPTPRTLPLSPCAPCISSSGRWRSATTWCRGACPRRCRRLVRNRMLRRAGSSSSRALTTAETTRAPRRERESPAERPKRKTRTSTHRPGRVLLSMRLEACHRGQGPLWRRQQTRRRIRGQREGEVERRRYRHG